MALFQPSALIQGVSGTLGGTTFALGSGGRYVRAAGQKCNPRTFFALTGRRGFSNAVEDWRGLSQAQRQGWINLAARTYRTDRVGTQKTYNARSLFLSQACITGRVGLPNVLDAPGLGTRQFFATISVAYTALALTYAFTAFTFSGTGWVIAYACRSFSQGGFARKSFFVIDARSFGSSGTVNLTTQFENHFLKPIAGEFYALRFRVRYPGSLWSLPFEVVHRRT